jgi:hypothetical protein
MSELEVSRLTERVSPGAFLEYLAAEMSWDMPLSASTSLDDDLSLDSVARYELLCVVEDLGVVLDETQLGAWQTLGDLYDAYTEAGSSIQDELLGQRDGAIPQRRADDLQAKG